MGITLFTANVRGPKDMGLKIPMLTRKDFVENFLKLNRNGVLRADLVCCKIYLLLEYLANIFLN